MNCNFAFNIYFRTLDKSIPRLAKRIILHGGIASSPWVIETNPIEPGTLALIRFLISNFLISGAYVIF